MCAIISIIVLIACAVRQSSTQLPDTETTSPASVPVTCSTAEGGIGECIKYYLCNMTFSQVDGFRTQPCPSYLDECCPLNNIRTEYSTTPNVENLFGLSGPSTRIIRAAPDGTIRNNLIPGTGSTVSAPESTSTPLVCTTNDGEIGECISYYLCNKTSIIINGDGLLNIRDDSQKCSYLEECCPVANRIPTEPQVTQNNQNSSYGSIVNQSLTPPVVPSNSHLHLEARPADNAPLVCTTNDGEIGECISYYLCNKSSVILDGVGLLNIRDDSQKCSYLEECCPVANRIPTEPQVTQNNQNSSYGSIVDQNLTPPVVPSSSHLHPEDPADNAPLTCRTLDGEIGECIKYYLCESKNIISDNIGVIDIRNNPNQICPSYVDVCCQVSKKIPPEDSITQKPDQVKRERVGCGWRNPTGVGLDLSFGEDLGETMFGEFPWMVAVLKTEPLDENDPDGPKKSVSYIGGGSLIHPSVVLTTLSKVVPVKKLRVRAGEWDTQTTKEIYPFQEREVGSVDVQKDFYRDRSLDMLLFLVKPVDLAPNVGLACLPAASDRMPTGTRCYATGWGKEKFGNVGSYQTILNKIQLPLVDQETCKAHLRKTLQKTSDVPNSLICAGGEAGKDTCVPDGGSPLSCPVKSQKDRYVQSGIAASGYGCDKDGTIGVYVDVAHLRGWIDEKVTRKGYSTSAYDLQG